MAIVVFGALVYLNNTSVLDRAEHAMRPDLAAPCGRRFSSLPAPEQPLRSRIETGCPGSDRG
ncbi:MAG: hypothetical protein GY719_28930 [bacterium]|nr:hypothetical protein [bacterium]